MTGYTSPQEHLDAHLERVRWMLQRFMRSVPDRFVNVVTGAGLKFNSQLAEIASAQDTAYKAVEDNLNNVQV